MSLCSSAWQTAGDDPLRPVVCQRAMRRAAAKLDEPIARGMVAKSTVPASQRAMSLSNARLLSFIALCDRRTVAGAADQLKLGMPAVAKALRETEQQLGRALFERIGKRTLVPD